MTKKNLKILFLGDIVGKPGRRAVSLTLPSLKQEESIDFVIANGENLAGGKGMTYDTYVEMKEAGVDCFTSGNHIWNNEDIIPYLSDSKTSIIRPANYPDNTPGKGQLSFKVQGNKLLVANLQGRVFMKDDIEDPFIIGKNIADENKDSVVIIDFHAEATSEKIALGYYLDGRITALIGTHTHVQTADDKVLPEGTGFISDAGMCGPENSVLGVKKEIIIEKFLTQLPQSHKVATGDAIIHGVYMTIDTVTKKTKSIKRLSKVVKL